MYLKNKDIVFTMDFELKLKQKTQEKSRVFCFSREDGIRTHDTVAHIQTFQACSFNHSDTSLKRFANNLKKNEV